MPDKESDEKTLILYQTNARSRTQMMRGSCVHDLKYTKGTENYVRDGESHGKG